MPEIYYYRSTAGREVDFVLENRAGEVVGIEVKASATVSAVDFKGLREIRGLLGKQFIKGVVLYAGRSTVSFGKNLFAVPVSALWLR